MSERELDRWALEYFDAVTRCDLDAVERFWTQAANDPALEAMLHEMESSAEDDAEAEEESRTAGAIADAVRTRLPTATLDSANDGPLTVARVAEELQRLGAADPLTARLRSDTRVAPPTKSLTSLLAWAEAEFGEGSDAYWRAFRSAAMRLRVVRDDAQYGLAARSAKPKVPPS